MRSVGYSIFLGCLFLASCGGPREAPPASTAPAPEAQPAAASDDSSTASGYQTMTVTDGGSLAGTISVSGPVPKLAPRPINKDAAVCGTGSRPSEDLMVGKGGGLKNAVVIVRDVKRGKAMPAVAARINQSKCEYIPHVQVMPANTDISIVNSDPILHNIHFYQGDADLFNIAQPMRGQTNTHKIEKAGFVYAECDVHGWMKGHVAVVDNPYYAVTDENGTFSIGDVPAGKYTVTIWHEFLGEQSQTVTVAGKATSTLNADLKELLAKRSSANPAPAAPASAAGAATAGKPAPGAPPAPPGLGAPPSERAQSGEVTVQMVSDGGTFRFEPSSVTIKAGTTVKWVNGSDNRHSATDDPKFEKSPGMAILPADGEAWSTAFIGNGQEASHMFTAPGRYQYFCRNHGQFGMVATITVVP